MNRTRTFSWQDPMLGAKAARDMTGLEYLQAIERGELPAPPIMATLDIRPHQVSQGCISFKLTPAEYHYNSIGTVHGGVISTLVDSAMACAIHTLLPKGTAYTTLELKVNFLKSLKSDTGEVMCEGKAIHVGGRVATAEARVTDEAGTLYAHATTTCLLFRGKTD
jgi:uncharacterized protein (TIGR00369 family)